jgi:hypothetical protein
LFFRVLAPALFRSTRRIDTAQQIGAATMALFRMNPEKQMASDIAAARTNRDRMSARLLEAEQAVVERRRSAQRLALDGADDLLLDKAEAALRASQDRATTLASAITDAEQHLAALEKAQAEYQDQKTRAATAAEAETLASDMESIATDFDGVITRLAAISERATSFCGDASGLVAYAGLSKTQVPDAIAMIRAMLHAHAVNLLSVPVAPPEPNVVLFAMKPVRWLDADGRQNLGQRFTDIEVPPALVARALSSGACVRFDDPRRRQNHGVFGGRPDKATCFDLSDADKPAPAAEPQSEPIKHSAFTPIDRGGPIQMKVAR